MLGNLGIGAHLKSCFRLLVGTFHFANIYLFKVNNRNARKRCEICSKLTVKTSTMSLTSFWCFIVNFEHISNLFLVFLFVDFKQVNVGNHLQKYLLRVKKITEHFIILCKHFAILFKNVG